LELVAVADPPVRAEINPAIKFANGFAFAALALAVTVAADETVCVTAAFDAVADTAVAAAGCETVTAAAVGTATLLLTVELLVVEGEATAACTSAIDTVGVSFGVVAAELGS